MRQLFDEYERDTTGQWTTIRDDTQLRGAVVPWFELKAERADEQVSVRFRLTGDFVADYRLSPAQAVELARMLVESVEDDGGL